MKIKWILYIFICFVLNSCASSSVSRSAAMRIDKSSKAIKDTFKKDPTYNFADSYQNASQATKGVMLGGAAGAVTGATFTSGIGLLPPTLAGMIMGATLGGYIDKHKTILDELENRGAQVIRLGDHILISIPSARLFVPMTSTIKLQSHCLLALAAAYVNKFTKILVQVSAYTDDSGAKQADQALSRQQAQAVAKQLLAYGIDARILYAEGYGGVHLVKPSNLEWDSDNYRIEITLEKLYVDSPYRLNGEACC